jgi:hypothetical protein
MLFECFIGTMKYIYILTLYNQISLIKLFTQLRSMYLHPQD